MQEKEYKKKFMDTALQRGKFLRSQAKGILDKNIHLNEDNSSKGQRKGKGSEDTSNAFFASNDIELSNWNLPFNILPDTNESDDGFPLYEKMKYNKMLGLKDFDGRFILLKLRKDDSNYLLGRIERTKKNFLKIKLEKINSTKEEESESKEEYYWDGPNSAKKKETEKSMESKEDLNKKILNGSNTEGDKAELTEGIHLSDESIVLDISNKNSHKFSELLLIEYSFFSKQLNSLIIIVSNFITKKLFLSKTDDDSFLYSGFILKQNEIFDYNEEVKKKEEEAKEILSKENHSEKPKEVNQTETQKNQKTSKKLFEMFKSISAQCFSSEIKSLLIFPVSQIPKRESYLYKALGFAYKVNTEYSKFLIKNEFMNISLANIPRYVMHELWYLNELWILLYVNKEENKILLRNYSNNQLVKNIYTENAKFKINVLKGPVNLKSLQVIKDKLFKCLRFKNTKNVFIFDDPNDDVNYLKFKEKDAKNAYSLCECEKCKYTIKEFSYLVCFNCNKIYHKDCLEENELKTCTINQDCFSCKDCHPCSYCKNGYSDDSFKKLTCTICEECFHIECIPDDIRHCYSKEINSENFKCEKCIQCGQCKSTVKDIKKMNPKNKFNSDCSYCLDCETKRKNNEYCPICNDLWYNVKDGTLIECKCKMHFHKSCDRIFSANPSLNFSTKKKYCCPLCRIKRNEIVVDKFIKQAKSFDLNEFFIKPVDLNQFPHYLKVIKEPMCFEDILRNNTEGYYLKDITKLFHDLMLIPNNTMIFNMPNDYIYKAAITIKKQFNKIIQENYQSLYQMSFEYYLFDYYSENIIGHNSSNFETEIIKVLKEKFTEEILEKMGKDKVIKKLNEYKIKWDFLSQFGIIQHNGQLISLENEGEVEIILNDEENSKKEENEAKETLENVGNSPNKSNEGQSIDKNNIAHSKQGKRIKCTLSEVNFELDLHYSNFEIARKSQRHFKTIEVPKNINKMEINEGQNASDPNKAGIFNIYNYSLKDELEQVNRKYEVAKSMDYSMTYLYPKYIKEYFDNYDDHMYIDFLSSFIPPEDTLRNIRKKRKDKNLIKANGNTPFYDEENRSEDASGNDEESLDENYEEKPKKKEKKKKRAPIYGETPKIKTKLKNLKSIGSNKSEKKKEFKIKEEKVLGKKRKSSSKTPLKETKKNKSNISSNEKKSSLIESININDSEIKSPKETQIEKEKEIPIPKKIIEPMYEPYKVAFSQSYLIYSKNCTICGSFDDIQSMITCSVCANSFHCYCLPKENISIEYQYDINALRKYKWKCQKCKVCEICLKSAINIEQIGPNKNLFSYNSMEDDIINCTVCNASFHNCCLKYPIKLGVGFKCSNCFKCKECNTNIYYNTSFKISPEKNYTEYTRNFTFCFQCGFISYYNAYCNKCERQNYFDYSKPIYFIKNKERFNIYKDEIEKIIGYQKESKDNLNLFEEPNDNFFDEIEER
ncbi:MAG: hypothetical protein MJ252_01960, partial [archaeon]|nr:hypothetical protein [archaeon]